MKTATKTRFSDIVLDDSRLSMAAKGVFLTLGFMGNSCTLSQLMQRCSDSKEKLEDCIKELRQAEYITLEGDTVAIKAASSFGIA
jgi:hypothetical protein